MAAKELMRVTLRAKVIEGTDEITGDLILKNRNFNNIKLTAQPIDLLDGLESVIKLQKYDLAQIDVIDTSILQRA